MSDWERERKIDVGSWKLNQGEKVAKNMEYKYTEKKSWRCC